METLIDLDKKIFLFLNGMHSPIVDQVMYYASETLLWMPLFLFLFFLIFKDYKKNGWYILLGAALTILLADQITTSFMKPFFARPRPSHEPTLQGVVHIVNGYAGGLYGFASSHAANTFGMALFIWLTLKQYHERTSLIFLWAALMTYTRIYLGVHYPGDILVGAGVGLLAGWIGFKISRWLLNRFGNAPATET